jgi:hypothetical protein
MDSHIDSLDRKELTMKRITTILATVSLVLAVGAPVASAKHVPGANANSHGVRHVAQRPAKQIQVKVPGKKAAFHTSRHMRAV